MLAKNKLKPCPFCGGEAHLQHSGWPHHVYCVNCGASVVSTKMGRSGTYDVKRKWNARIEDGVLRVTMEKVNGSFETRDGRMIRNNEKA